MVQASEWGVFSWVTHVKHNWGNMAADHPTRSADSEMNTTPSTGKLLPKRSAHAEIDKGVVGNEIADKLRCCVFEQDDVVRLDEDAFLGVDNGLLEVYPDGPLLFVDNANNRYPGWGKDTSTATA